MSFELDQIYIIEPNHSEISGIRLLQDGERILFRVKGNVSQLDFYGPCGGGHEYTFHIQTAEGVVELPVESNTFFLTDDSITFSVPPSGRDILNNIEKGTRFIFAVTKPAEETTS